MQHDVVIVGAGPIGLMLAAELRLAGVSVLVLERLAKPTGLSKALGLIGRSDDYLALRGLETRFIANGLPLPETVRRQLYHFGMIQVPVECTELTPKGLFIPQARTEALLLEWAESLGVTVARGVSVTGLSQNNDGVVLQALDHEVPTHYEARFVVGCDGAHSIVRKLTGVGFEGLDATKVLRLGDVKLAPDSPVPRVFIPLDDGYARVITQEALPPNYDRHAPMRAQELIDSITRVYGVTIQIAQARWLSRFTDTSRQATHYRVGRVFLAGDAAHVHLPAGGPGLLTGLGDALNLGWKLGCVVRGDADASLLNTYHQERHPVGVRVLQLTRAQNAIMNFDPCVTALRGVLEELAQLPQVATHIMQALWQSDVKYTSDDADASPLTGTFLSNVTVETNEGPRPIYDFFHAGQPVWLATAAWHAQAPVAKAQARRLRVVTLSAPLAQPQASALLARPDGHIAWLSDAAEPQAAACASRQRVLACWYGLVSLEASPPFAYQEHNRYP